MNALPIPQFRVFTGEQVAAAVRGGQRAILDTVEAAYRAHHAGRTVNPESQFLRFPDAQRNRIIALPAHIQGDEGEGITGIKWISSFPENIERGVPRASAVLILNDAATGYPMACMEASIISAARTAASAVSALRRLTCGDRRGDRRDDRRRHRRVAFVGAGVIARHVAECLPLAALPVEEVVVHDLNPGYADSLANRIAAHTGIDARTDISLESVVRRSDVIVFATTASSPYLDNPDWFSHCPVVLHLSLRDLAPSIVLEAYNVVDDIEHCLRAKTSLHLTEVETGHRRFVTTSLPHLLCGGELPARDRPLVFSPFGLGILDIAVGRWVYERLADRQAPVPRFFFDLQRA